MTTHELENFLIRTLNFSYSDFDIFEQPGCIAIIIYKWVWWWKRKKISKSIFDIRPIGIMVRWYFCRKYYATGC